MLKTGTRPLLPYFACFALALAAFLLLQQSRISITDIDGIAYVEGAYSLQAGQGYTSLTGQSLNHWPPAYSFLLAFSPEPKAFSLAINAVSFALAAAMLLLLTHENGWSWITAFGFTLAVSFGFLLSLARAAKPDILTFAVFLLGLRMLYSPQRWVRLMGYALWSVLIPVKLIALVFTPAGILTELILARIRHTKIQWGSLFLAGIVWALMAAVVVGFNLATIGSPVPSSHESASISTVASAAVEFVTTIPRDFLANWYGSLRGVSALVPFVIVLAASLASLSSLRLQRDKIQYALLGLALLAITAMLILVRNFGASPRLTAYGFFPLFLCFRPRARWSFIWGIYGVAAILLAVYNFNTQNGLGLNDPRYEQIAHAVVSEMDLPAEGTLYTNAARLLDVQTRTATVALSETLTPESLEQGAYLLLVGLPNYDAVMRPITPVTLSDAWCEVDTVENAVLWQKCAPEQ